MRIDILSIFPQMILEILSYSIIKRALTKNLVEIYAHDLRSFTTDKHRMVDDQPYGGGVGMIMKIEPIYQALEYLKQKTTSKIHSIYLTPQGQLYNQKIAQELSQKKHIVLLCGRYEDIDYRVRERYIDQEISIGDYILSGGELAAMVLTDSIVRLIPEVLGDANSAVQDSFSTGLLDFPHYTRPREFKGQEVPPVLLSGDHQKIREWRQKQALKQTLLRRPDLLKNYRLSPQEQQFLKEIKAKCN